jgi:hypothetical protein
MDGLRAVAGGIEGSWGPRGGVSFEMPGQR